MKNRIRLVVYSALCIPIIGFALYVGSFDGRQRGDYLRDFGANIGRVFAGDLQFADLTKEPRPGGGGRGGRQQWRGQRGQFGKQEAFDLLDVNQNDTLESDEIGARLRTTLTGVDKNRDGVFSREEYQQGLYAGYFQSPAATKKSPNGAGEGESEGESKSSGTSETPTSKAADSKPLSDAELRAQLQRRLFDPQHVVQVQIDMPENEWRSLCNQSRSFQQALADPSNKPYSYFHGTITVDGVKIPDVAIRKKGFIGSQDGVRPALKIKFGKHADDPGIGVPGLTLNNNKQDSSLLSQSLTYQVFRKAQVAAPRCTYAAVTVNGSYLGIYSNVEAVRQPLLTNSFGDGSGNLYEGTLTDFYPKSIEWLEAETNKKANDRSRILKFAELLEDESTTLADLDAIVNVDNFLRYWAVESLINFWDGYTQNQNNFFTYDNPVDGKFYFLPWGADSCFTNRRHHWSESHSHAVGALSIFANRLYHMEGIPSRYRQVMLEVLDQVWDEEALLAETKRIERLLFDHVDFSQVEAYSAMQTTRSFIRNRRKVIMAELNNWPATVQSRPRIPLHNDEIGSITGTFPVLRDSKQAASSAEEDSLKSPIERREPAEQSITVTLEDEVLALEAANIRIFHSTASSQTETRAVPQRIECHGQLDGLPATIKLDLQAHQTQNGSPEQFNVQGDYAGLGRGQSQPNNIRGTLTLEYAPDTEVITGHLDLQIIETKGGFRNRGRR